MPPATSLWSSPWRHLNAFFFIFRRRHEALYYYLDDLAKRTYFGTDGTEPQRSGVLGYLIEGLEGLLGFFGLVILPAMAAATLYHWIFD